MSTLKIGDKYKALQPFAGARFSLSQDEEVTVTMGNIDNVELWLRGGLVVKTYSFSEPIASQSETKNRPEQENEDSGILPVGDVPRPRGRKRAAPSDGG